MTQTRKMLFGVVGALSACALVACEGTSPTMGPKDYGDITGVEEIGQPLTAFSAVAWDAGTGAMTLNFNGTETLLVVAKHPVSGAIIVNDVATAATATSLKKLFISGTATAGETVIIDFANGTFAPGITGAGGQGISVNMAAGADFFKVRGSGTAGDTIALGGTALNAAISTNLDLFPDITVQGTGTIGYTFSLGGGNDTFNATASQYGVVGPFQATAPSAAATGSVTAGADTADSLEATTVTLDDGVHGPVVFEFDTSGGTPGVAAGHVRIALTTGATAGTVATALMNATNGVGAALDITASISASPAVVLTNKTQGAFANTRSAIVTTTGWTLSAATMTGGVGGGGAGVTVYGGLGDDTLTGSAGDDFIYGDLGVDTISGGNSATDSDVISGGANYPDGGVALDTVTYAARTFPLTVIVDGIGNCGEVHETDHIGTDVEIVIGGSGNDTFRTGIFSPGNHTFFGGPGNDTFQMGFVPDGADTFWGGAGIDTVDYSNRFAATVSTMDGVAANDGEVGENDNIQADVENFICPVAPFVCTVIGNALNNTITGGPGADVLSGGAGDDTFVMGFFGMEGAGADQISGGAGVDTVTFATFGATINVIMDGTASTTMGKKINTDVENLICDPTNACTVTGNASNNKIVGSSAADTISSMDGDDNVEGNGGDDVVDCGDGSDLLTGRATMVTTPPVACEL